MSKPSEPRRRFAPVPIETTFQQFRKPGPNPEPTPEPSPRSASPSIPAQTASDASNTETGAKEKRRFAPQLIDSSRRSRRVGDVGPATKPTDKTDITPYTNHIYSLARTRSVANTKARVRSRHAKTPSNGRRESCDEETASHVFDLLARDVEKRLQEVALSAFPNSGARAGGAEHFFVREGSEEEESGAAPVPDVAGPGAARGGKIAARGSIGSRQISRRLSEEEEVNWAVKEMQEHHDQLAKARGERVATPDLDQMDIDSPPEDALWTTRARTESSFSSMREEPMPFIPEEDQAKINAVKAALFRPPVTNAIPDLAPAVKPVGQWNRGPFGSPFAGHLRGSRDLERERELHKLRAKASPPMLGKDLVFRKCVSPKATKLEPEHPWNKVSGQLETANRDFTGQRGLWRGYCYTADARTALAPTERPPILHTPHPLPTSGDPFAAAFATAPVLSEEPTPTGSSSNSGSSSGSYGSTHSLPPGSVAVGAGQGVSSYHLMPEHRSRAGQPKGLHMLQGIDERLKREKAAADLDEIIAAEFTDEFVSQVFNYLSLGYPSMARAYDEELSRISRISVTHLESDDPDVLAELATYTGEGPKKEAKGFIKFEASADEPEEARCPRWRALKLYIFEWARQHPDLNSISPLAWGVRERRGSWGL